MASMVTDALIPVSLLCYNKCFIMVEIERRRFFFLKQGNLFEIDQKMLLSKEI